MSLDPETREKAIERLREDLSEDVPRDQLMAKAVNMYDQLNNNIHEEIERLRDWYSLHFPELAEEIGDDEEFMKILERGPFREDLDAFSGMAEQSTGTELHGADREILEETVDLVVSRREHRDRLESYVKEVAKDEMPNLSTLLGPVLAARMVALAGGLEELARKPASTVQMFGAEKALFRHLRGNGNPPKHGIIFQHHTVNSLHPDRRGKMARFLANKAVMAARLDQYGDKMKGEELKSEVDEKYQQLKEE
jgi:nucleolar protein 56